MSIPHAPRDDPTGVSPMREGIWFTERLGGAGSAYHLALTVTFDGPVDVGALAAACQAGVERHPVLGCGVSAEDGTPNLVPAAQMPSPGVEEMPAGQDDDPDRWWQARVRKEMMQAFDLSNGPLSRFAIVRTSPSQVRLLIVAHHLVFDGESKDILLRDLAFFYNTAPREPQPAPRSAGHLDGPAEPVRLADEQPAARDFWASRWRRPGPLTLPGLLTSQIQVSDGRSFDFSLEPELDLAITATARTCELTRFELLLAALQALILRYGNEQATVGIDLSTRARPTRQSIGLFVNELPVTARLSEGQAFREFAAAIRRQLRQVYRFRSVPLARAVTGLDPGLALTPVSLSYRRCGPDPTFDSLAIDVDRSVFNRAARNALHVHVIDGPRGMAISFRYSQRAISRADVARIAGHFRELLGAITTDPGTPVDELALLTLGERHRMLAQWNATGTEGPGFGLLHELVEAQVVRAPAAGAIIFADRVLTYTDLNERANRLARWLRGQGAIPGTLVAVCAERSPELAVALLAVLKAGAGYVPLDPGHPDERIAFLLQDSDPMLVLTQERLAARLSGAGIPVVLVDRPGPWQAQPGTDLAALAGPDDVASVIYTSGSTGRPKAVPNTHRGTCNTLSWLQQTFGLGGTDTVAHHTSVAFDVSAVEIFWPLLAGARIVMARPGGHRDPRYLRDLVIEHGVTTLQFVPSMLAAFLDTEGIAECLSLRQTICCGEQLPPRVVQGFFHLLPGELYNLYGPAEAAIFATGHPCRLADVKSAVVPSGRPIGSTRLYLLDRNLQPVPAGVVGEICIAGTGLARGYHRAPGLTALRFIPNPVGPPGGRLYRTGDLARYRPDGNIEFLGRADHQVKLHGVRIEPGEIESLLRQQPGVRDAVVVVCAGTTGDEALAAYLVPHTGAGLDVARLRQVVRRTLPDYMRPGSYTVLDTFPVTPNGKIDRAALPPPRHETAAAGPGSTGLPAAADPVTEGIRAIWCAVLGLEHVEVDADLFELGGHSLTVTQIAVRMRRTLGIDLPLNVFYDTPTILDLARAAASRRPTGAPREGATP
jgi:amino acid adenylation domain-containing protein